MRLGKKAKRGTRVKKLANGGNGDPVKEAVASPELATDYSDELSLAYLNDMESGRLAQNPLTAAVELGAAVIGGGARAGLQAAKTGYQYIAAPLARFFNTPLVKGAASEIPLGGGASQFVPGATMTVGQALELGATTSAAANIAPNAKEFADDPTLGKGLILGLDAATLYVGTFKPALQGFKQFVRAQRTPASTPAIQLSSPTTDLSEAVKINAEVNEAALFFDSSLKNSLIKTNKVPFVTEAQRIASNEKTLSYWNELAESSANFNKVMFQRRYLQAFATNDQQWLKENLSDGIYKTVSNPERRPFYADRTSTGEPFTLSPTTPIQVYTFEEVGDDAFIPIVQLFEPEAYQAQSVAILENIRNGSKSSAYATYYAMSELNEKAQRIRAENQRQRLAEVFDDVPEQPRKELPFAEQALVGSQARGMMLQEGSLSQRGVQSVDEFGLVEPDFRLQGEGFEVRDGVLQPMFNDPEFSLERSQKMYLDIERDASSFHSTRAHETHHAALEPIQDLMAQAQFTELHTLVNSHMYIAANGRTEYAPAPGVNTLKEIKENMAGIIRKYAYDPEFTEFLLKPKQILYLASPSEQMARFGEMRDIIRYEIMEPRGLKMDDYDGKLTVDDVKEAYSRWLSSGARAQSKRSQMAGRITLDLMKGETQEEKFKTMTSLMNLTLGLLPVAVGTTAVATQADINAFSTSESTATPTPRPPLGLDRGGLVKKLVKKKRRGYRSV